MKVSPEAGRGHLLVGAALVGVALLLVGVAVVVQTPFVAAAVFFSGVWGGVELGRYLERSLRRRREPQRGGSNAPAQDEGEGEP